LDKLPLGIAKKFYDWVESVRISGIIEVRKSVGYHDETLLGKRHGQRSLRLNKAYRAIYVEREEITIIQVIEVNKHDY
jgi:toxin HigB-1